MKLKPTYLAVALLAGSSVAVAEGFFEHHGYLRSGALFDLEDDLTQFDGGGDKETLGRLGLETDNFFELEFVKGWNLDDGKFIKIHNRLGQHNTDIDQSDLPDREEDPAQADGDGDGAGDGGRNTANTLFGLNIDGTEVGLIESYVELGGIVGGKDTVIWGGRRYYQRSQNYSFITDLFYTDYSGTGIGIEKLPLGAGTAEFAWITSEEVNSNSFGQPGTEGVLHSFHFGYDINSWNFEYLAKYYPTNGSTDNTDDTDLASTGNEILASYNFKNFFGIGNGFSKLSFQVGDGLSTGSGLGCTSTNYCGFRTFGGSTVSGAREDDGTSFRLTAHGGLFTSQVLLFPHFMYESHDQENDVDAEGNVTRGDLKEIYSFALRSVFLLPSIDNFTITTEAGHSINTYDQRSDVNSNKFVVAPTFALGSGEGPTPEIRFLLGYNGGQLNNENLLIGFQVDTWW